MNKNKMTRYLLALVLCFLAGCCISLGLLWLDGRSIRPLSGGQTLDFSVFGFSLSVPQEAVVRDHTQDNAQLGGRALYAGSINSEDGTLYLFCYENETGDSLSAYDEQDVVTHYMSAGATDVRMREFGGRRFICYRASVQNETGIQLWDTYETWDDKLQITFETQMAASKVLPILATIDFRTPATR